MPTDVAANAITATYGGAQLNEIFYEPVFRSDDIADAIVNRAVKGIASDVVRLAWGGDVAGAVAGYAVFNGWMELMKAEPVLTQEATDPANPTAQNALDIIMKVYDGAPAALQQVAPADKKMFVTPKLYNAYLQNLEGNGADLAIVNRVDAAPRVSFRGVEIM